MNYLKSFFLAALIGLSLNAWSNSNLTENTQYQVDINKSQVSWKGEKVTGFHEGHITVKSGVLQSLNGQLNGADLTIDMNSITCTDLKDQDYNQKLVGHLKSDDFFSVAAFPEATFQSTRLTPLKKADKDGHNFEITGKLTIKGITHEISFPATIDVEKSQLKASGKMVFDRTKWDIRYGSNSFFDNLGDRMIYNDVEIAFELKAQVEENQTP